MAATLAATHMWVSYALTQCVIIRINIRVCMSVFTSILLMVYIKLNRVDENG